MIFSKTTSAVLATLFIGFLTGGSALACSTDGWDVVSGAVEVGSPYGTTPPDVDGISRYEELCAMRANGTGYVQSNSPSHSRVRGRMYFWPNLTPTRGVAGATTVLSAFSDEGGASELFHISYDSGSWIVDAGANGGGSNSAAASGGWEAIEVDWNPGSATLDVWIGTDATMDSPTFSIDPGSAATLESVQVGAPDGLGNYAGAVYVDSVELRNETAIGLLLPCDADGNDLLNFNDVSTMYFEQFPPQVLSTGTPDCDANGLINFNDISTLYFILFPPP